MKVTELDDLIVKLITEADHPEITDVEVVPTSSRPDNHTRLVVHFASGASAVVMVRQVAAAGGRRSGEFEIPREAL